MSTPFWVAIIKTLIVGFMGWARARKESLDALSAGDASKEPRWGGELVAEKPQLTSDVRPINNKLA